LLKPVEASCSQSSQSKEKLELRFDDLINPNKMNKKSSLYLGLAFPRALAFGLSFLLIVGGKRRSS